MADIGDSRRTTVPAACTKCTSEWEFTIEEAQEIFDAMPNLAGKKIDVLQRKLLFNACDICDPNERIEIKISIQ